MIAEGVVIAPGVVCLRNVEALADYEAYRQAWREAVAVALAERELPGSPKTELGVI